MRDNIQVDVPDLLATLEIDNVREIGRGEFEFSCPFTDRHAFGDTHPSSHMQKANGLWRCKTCHAEGNAFDFVVKVKACKPIEALRFLRERYGQGFRAPEGGALAIEREQVEARWEEERRRRNPTFPVEAEWIGHLKAPFFVDWYQAFATVGTGSPHLDYMLKRGFSPRQLKDWGIGYDSWTDRIVIPIRDEYGKLIGFKGRAWRDEVRPRYLLLGDTPERKPRHGIGYGFDMLDPVQTPFIFGLDRAVKSGSRTCVPCEGEFNTVALHGYGARESIAFGASWFSDQQLRLLRWYFDKAIIFFDSDPAGESATWGYTDEKNREHIGLVERLIDFMQVEIVPAHEGDPASMSRDEALSLIDQSIGWKSYLTASLTAV